MRPPLPSAAVLSFSPLHTDARVQRQIRALKTICRVTAMGWTDPCIEDVRFVDVSQRPLTILQKAYKGAMLKAGFFETVYHSEESVRKAAEALADHDCGLIVANDIGTLPVVLAHRKRAKILFDAHEYAPREFEHWFLWRFFMQKYKEHLCRARIPQVDAMTTVGPAIADEYARVFGVRPSVVLNAPYYHTAPPVPRDSSVIRMVHHGSASSPRRLETMIDAMAHLDERFRLDLMLIPNDPSYIKALKKRASSDRRIAFVPPVLPEEIVEKLSDYDVGLCTYAPYSFNGLNALPNKFFDFIQARLCVAANHLPEVTRLVEQYNCGIVAKDFTAHALAETLRTLDRQKVEACRQAADIAAVDLCYERSAEVLLDTARKLLGLEGEKRAEGETEVAAH